MRGAVAIDSPPPRAVTREATSFAALAGIGTDGWFARGVSRRLLVLLTDGESRPFAHALIGHALHGPPRTALVVVRVGNGDERVYGPDGAPLAAYRPDPGSTAELAALTAATGGRSFDETDLGGAETAARQDLGKGPTVNEGVATSQTALGPYLALAALLPLAGLLRLRNLR
jgi:hypothetical protein